MRGICIYNGDYYDVTKFGIELIYVNYFYHYIMYVTNDMIRDLTILHSSFMTYDIACNILNISYPNISKN